MEQSVNAQMGMKEPGVVTAENDAEMANFLEGTLDWRMKYGTTAAMMGILITGMAAVATAGWRLAIHAQRRMGLHHTAT